MRAAAIAGALCAACGASGLGPRATAPADPTPLGKCKIAASAENPLVTEWSASEKANLEARLRGGAVAVEYSGCEMRLLSECRLPGRYAWRRTTTTTDTLEVTDTDELFTKLPLGAVALEGELERSGRIAVQTTVAGQFELERADASAVPAQGPCARATHVVAALSVGAFKLRSGGAVAGRAGATMGSLGAGTTTSSQETVMRSAGDPDACKLAGADAPDAQCGSPIQVFLRPLPKQDVGAPGTVKVSFVSSAGDTTWDVRVGERSLCQTPCNRWIDPIVPLSMVHEEGFLERDQEVSVPDLREHGRGPLEVRAQPRSTLGQLGGLTLTTFAGLGVAAGTTFLAVGCTSDDRSGLCTAGAITLPLSLAALVPGIWLLVTSGEHATVSPAPTGAL